MPCPNCGHITSNLTPEQFEERLDALEPVALEVLAKQTQSLDERVAANAAKMLLEWKRGKPKQQIEQTTDQITRIVYETAAWMPEVHLIKEQSEITSGEDDASSVEGTAEVPVREVREGVGEAAPL